MITAAIWLAWFGLGALTAQRAGNPDRTLRRWRVAGGIAWTFAAILATIAVNRP